MLACDIRWEFQGDDKPVNMTDSAAVIDLERKVFLFPSEKNQLSITDVSDSQVFVDGTAPDGAKVKGTIDRFSGSFQISFVGGHGLSSRDSMTSGTCVPKQRLF
jgi:hypothetical protein